LKNPKQTQISFHFEPCTFLKCSTALSKDKKQSLQTEQTKAKAPFLHMNESLASLEAGCWNTLLTCFLMKKA